MESRKEIGFRGGGNGGKDLYGRIEGELTCEKSKEKS